MDTQEYLHDWVFSGIVMRMSAPKGTQRAWTDEEYGHIQRTLEQPVAQVAWELGRSGSSVQNARHRIRKGWSPTHDAYDPWREQDDEFLISNPKVSAKEVAAHLGRSLNSVHQRRMLLRRTREGVESSVGNFSPFSPGARSLLAQTCPSCGLLLQAQWFQADRGGRCKTCKRCRRAESAERGVFTGRKNGKSEREKIARLEKYRHWQRVTIDKAENRGQPWTDSDLRVLADPDLTIFQKALKLKRTWAGVQVAAQKNGFRNKVGLGDPERDQWHIENPNADRIDEIRAQFSPVVEVPRMKLELVGAPKRPDFDWDD